jgi:tetratricopeptide (TPR) repeat protein
MSASFEAAFQQVDAHLESLVQAEVPRAAAPVAPPSVKASVSGPPVLYPSPAAPPPSDTPAASQTGDSDAPDAWDDFSLDGEVLAGEPSDEAAKARRQRLLQRTVETMGSLGTPPAPAKGAPVAPTAPRPASAAPAPSVSDDQQLAQLIEQRYADVQAKRDHFTMLGLTVGPEVKREQVKTTFLALAKRFHPDRLPPALSALAPKVTVVFEAIRESYEVLYDDAKRVAYLQELRGKAGSPQPQQPQQAAPRSAGGVDPGDLFKMGEVFFRKRDFAAAVDHYERAYNGDPKGLYLAARAWAIYMDPQRKAEVPKAKQLMVEALKLDPNCDRAHYQLGVIARVENDMDRAERHFREAVRANPKHLEANQELRLIEMRKKNPPPPKKGGLFR